MNFTNISLFCTVLQRRCAKLEGSCEMTSSRAQDLTAANTALEHELRRTKESEASLKTRNLSLEAEIGALKRELDATRRDRARERDEQRNVMEESKTQCALLLAEVEVSFCDVFALVSTPWGTRLCCVWLRNGSPSAV